MTKEDVLKELTVCEYAGFKRFANTRPTVYGMDSEGQTRVEFAASDLQEYLNVIRSKPSDTGSVGETAQTI